MKANDARAAARNARKFVSTRACCRASRAQLEAPRAAIAQVTMLSAGMTPSASSSAATTLPSEVLGQFPTDMDVDADDSLALLEAHDAPAEKVDADFFNGEGPVAMRPAIHRRLSARGGTCARRRI